MISNEDCRCPGTEMSEVHTALVTAIEDTSAALYLAQHQRIFRLCRRLLCNSYEAEDVTQEVFEKLVHEVQAGKPVLSWEAWLTRVTINTCCDRRRSAWWKWSWSEAVIMADEQLSSSYPTPEEFLRSREQQIQLWMWMQKLSSRQREVFVLRRVEGLSNEDVANLLCVTTGSVKRHFYLALRHLQKAREGESRFC